MGKTLDEFNAYQQRMNKKILAANDKTMKRIYNTDTNAYLAGAMDVKTKELLGLVASMVLRCDDCVRYHLLKAHENGVSTEEVFEVFGIANLVGGSIVIPHTRRALEFWEEISASEQ